MSLNSYFRWNSMMIPPLGFLLNFTLLWLILRRTPKEMWLHSRVLLQTCIFDILLLCLFMFGMPYGAIVEEKTLFMLEGYMLGFRLNVFDLKNNPLCMLNLFSCWFFLYVFDVIGIAVQFLYRYLVMNRRIKINLRRYLCLLIIPFILTFCVVFTVYKSFTNAVEMSPAELSKFLVDFNNQTQIAYVVLEFDLFFLKIGILQCSIFYTISYSIIFICGRKMVQHVAAYSMHQNLKTLNRQLSRSLIICAICPLVLEAAHIALFFGSILPSFANAGLLLTSTFHWLPILNPLANLWAFRPYRDAFIQPLKKARIFIQ